MNCLESEVRSLECTDLSSSCRDAAEVRAKVGNENRERPACRWIRARGARSLAYAQRGGSCVHRLSGKQLPHSVK
jgi:hypothetical protein